MRVPIGGKVRELPGILGDRTSGILVPTVTVRMEEAYNRMNETAIQVASWAWASLTNSSK